MKVFIEDSEQRGYLSQNNYIEKTVKQVFDMLSITVSKIDDEKEEMTAYRLMLCKSWLENLLDNLTC